MIRLKMRTCKTLLFFISVLGMTAFVIGRAFYQKKQFYPALVYLTKSSSSMAVLYVQALVFVFLLTKVCIYVMFGRLRQLEMEHLYERGWYTVTETCLAFTILRDNFTPRFMAMFTLLLVLKAFHWLLDDRIDYMESTPVIATSARVRTISVIGVLTMMDFLVLRLPFSTVGDVWSPSQIIFTFEYLVLQTMLAQSVLKYILHCIDRSIEPSWERKDEFMLLGDVFISFCRLVVYLGFVGMMVSVETFPLFAVRRLYLAGRYLNKSLLNFVQSRRAIRNMNNLYRSATENDLSQGDPVCIICREEMTADVPTKVLPCAHIFHARCLRSWFQRQQSCPTCRLDVINPPVSSRASEAASPPPNVQNPPQAPVPPQIPVPPQMQMPPFVGVPRMPPFFPVAPPPAAAFASTATPQASTSDTSQSNSIPDGTPFNFSTFPFPMSPLMPPLPVPPPDLSVLDDATLRTMEGQSRTAIEARLRLLRDIETLMHASVVLMTQYYTLSSGLVSPSTSPEDQPLAETSDILTEKTTSEQPDTSETSNEGGDNVSDSDSLRHQRLQALGLL